MNTIQLLLKSMASWIVICITFSSGHAQDTSYYNRHFNPLISAKGAYFMNIVKKKDDGCTVYTVVVKDTQLLSVINYSDCIKRIREGRTRVWDPESGAMLVERNYKNNERQGTERVFYPNGQLRRQLEFDHDTAVSGLFFNRDGTAITDRNMFNMEEVACQIKPGFPGGYAAMQRFLAENIEYPEELRNQGIGGYVECSVIILPSGKLSDIKITDTPHPLLGEAMAKAVSKMPLWDPAIIDGIPVRVRYRMSYEFKK